MSNTELQLYLAKLTLSNTGLQLYRQCCSLACSIHTPGLRACLRAVQIQYKCNTLQYNTIQCKCNTIEIQNTMQRNTQQIQIQRNTAQYKYNTTLHNTTQCSTVKLTMSNTELQLYRQCCGLACSIHTSGAGLASGLASGQYK